MSERQITVSIIGDAASLERAFAKSSASARTFESTVTRSSRNAHGELGRLERGALAGSGAMHGLGRSVAFASGAFLGAAGLLEVMKSSVDVVLRSQTSIALLDTAIKNAHASVTALTPVLEAHAAAARKLGFDDDQTREAEAKLVTAFGATKKSLDELRVAENLARAQHEDLATASRQLILLQEGNTRAAKQFGLALPDLTSKQWAAKAAADGLNVAQEKGKTLYDELLPRIKDQAKAFADSPAGKIAEFHAQIEHLQESIGTGLLPVVNKYLTEVDDWLAKGKNQKKITDDVQKVVGTLVGVLHDAKKATEDFLKFAEPFVKDVGGWQKVIEGLVALKFATMIAGWAGAMGKAFTAAKDLRLGLLGLGSPEVLAALGAAAIGYSIYKDAQATTSFAIPGSSNKHVELKNGVFTVVTQTATRGSGGPHARKNISAAEAAALTGNPALAAKAVGNNGSSGSESSSSPGRAGAGFWSGDHAGLAGGFKSKLEAAAVDAGASAIYVSSGRRSPDHNTAVGGAHNSNHLTGHAADGTVTINGRSYPLGAAPLNYAKFGLRAGSTFDWGGSPDIYHVDDGSNVNGGVPASPYGPAATTPAGTPTAPKAPPWKGATQATIIGEQGHIAAMLKGLPSTLDPVEQNAVNHIKAIQSQLHLHMTPAELAKDKVELAKWGKVLHDEVTKNGKAAAAAAAAAKKTFDRALSLDMSHVLRDFDQNFSAQMRAFDRETQRGLAKFVVAQTPEEKALADYIAQRAAEQHAATVAQQQSDLAAAITSGDPAQIKAAQDAISAQLEDDQQAALQTAADASRVAQDAKTTADQQAYQDDRDAQKQALANINDDQRTALQNNLDDWTAWLDAKKKSYSDFLDWLRSQGFDTGGLVNPGASGQGSGNAPIGAATIPLPGKVYPFAAGGIVTRPTVALIGEGREAEGVFPLSVLGGLMGGSSKPLTVIVEMDGQQAARAVVPYQDGIVRVKIR